MSARDMARAIGRHAALRVAGTRLVFEVEILDARQRYGGTDYLVRPLYGEGEQWHAESSVTISEGATV